MVEMICTGGPFGDCCCNYNALLNHEYTVREFVEEVLKEKPDEWGSFVVTTDLKHIYNGSRGRCEYNKGNITKGFERAEIAEMKIKEVKANGGWSLMQYFIKV